MQSPHVTGSEHSVALDQQICQSNLSSEKKIAYLIFRGRVSKRVSFQSLPIFFPFSVVKKESQSHGIGNTIITIARR